MPRTTLTLEDDAMKVAKAHAKRHDLTLGAAVSQLVKRGADRPLAFDMRNGFAVVRLPKGSPTVTAETINRLLDEFP